MQTEFVFNHREEKGPGGARVGCGRKNASKRLRETIDARRSELLPPKSLLITGTTECACATYTSCDHCSDAKQKEAEESCRQLRVLFYASTNDIMTMEHSDAAIDYFVLCLAPRTFPPHFTLNSFAMLFSRVRTGKKKFAVGLKDTSSKSTQHLRQLKHSVQIVLWEHGYDSTGKWSPELVNLQAEKIAKDHADRKPKANKRKQNDHSVLPEAKRDTALRNLF
jgi:hypothetical protein